MSQQEDDKEPIILPGQMSYDELPPITNEPEQKQDAVIDGQVNMFETAPKVTTEKTENTPIVKPNRIPRSKTLPQVLSSQF